MYSKPRCGPYVRFVAYVRYAYVILPYVDLIIMTKINYVYDTIKV